MSLFEELKRRNVFRVGIAYGVTAWLLIQISDTVFPRIGLSESAITLVIALLGIGFIPALIFAWAFEMTPEGIKRERDVNRAKSITPQTGKKLDRMIIGILTVVIAFLVADRFILHRDHPATESASPAAKPDSSVDVAPAGTTAPARASIAVLPFVNMSADAENEYFSDGISEELLNVLVRVSALEVASRTSSFAYKGKDLPLSQVARELGVANILEGSVRKSGNRVRITAQLIDAGSDRHLWSDTYERELDDIFDIQEEISNHIVKELKIALDVGEAADMARLQRPTDNTDAYELYLQGRFQWRKRLEANIRSSIELFEDAIALDPGFAKAHEALASANAVLPAWSDAEVRASLEEADVHARAALMLDPSLAEARAIRAHVMAFNKDWVRSLNEFESALEIEPRNAVVRQWYAEVLSDVGYLRQALQQIERAYQLDPASPVINNVYNDIATTAGEDVLALRHMRIAQDLGIPFAVLTALPALLRSGDWVTIEQVVYPLAEEVGLGLLVSCVEAQRDPSKLAELRQKLTETREASDQPLPATYCAALAGDLDGAFDDLALELEEDPANIGHYWGQTPAESALRGDERFKANLRELGLLDLYEMRGWPDRCRPAGAGDFACD
jgi:TolB-like protein